VLLRKFGQEVIRITAGKRCTAPARSRRGQQSLTAAERDELLQDADQMIAWSRDAVHLPAASTRPTARCTTSSGCSAATSSASCGPTAPSTSTTALRLRDARGQIVSTAPCADYDAHHRRGEAGAT
jgi:NAD-reducing hydrogenase large subunit